MGRPLKKGVGYFPLDVDWDVKMKLVKARFGLAGIGCIIELYKLIYQEGYAVKWDDDMRLLFAAGNGIDEITLNEILNFALEKDLFSREILDSCGMLTSRGIQKRWQKIMKECRRTDVEIDDAHNLLSDCEKYEGVSSGVSSGKTGVSSGKTGVSSGKTGVSSGEKYTKQRKEKEIKAKQSKAEESRGGDVEYDDGFGEDSGESALPPAAASYMTQEVRNSQDCGDTAGLRDALASSGMSSSFSSREIEAVAEYLATHGLDGGFVTWAIGKAREPSVRNPGGFLKSALTGRGDFADFPERYREERYREESRPQQQEQQRSRAPSTCPKCGKKLKATSDRAACKACGLMLEYDESLDDWAEADEGLAAGADQVLAAIGVRR